MSDWQKCTKCTKCGEYDFVSRHRCKPQWFVQIDEHHDLDDPGDGVTVYAHDAEDAARDGVEQWDDERDALNFSYLVRATPVNQELGSAPEWFTVDAEASVEYYAHKAEAPTAG
jgi:hypothetical protein